MKKIWLLTMLVVGSFLQAEQEQNLADTPKDQIVVAFDLHEVLFNFSYSKVVRAIYQFFRKNPSNLTLLNPVCGYRVVQVLLNGSKTAEHIFDTLTQKYYPGLKDSRHDFFVMCNSYDENSQMIELVKELKRQGYHVAICSNIGKDVFKEFRELYPDVFELFDEIYTSRPEKQYLRKPAPEFFKFFKEETEEKLNKADLKYVFADDKLKNVKAAQKSGMKAFLFKNAAAFRADLNHAGIKVAA